MTAEERARERYLRACYGQPAANAVCTAALRELWADLKHIKGTATMTKTAFLAALRAELVRLYPWAAEPGKLEGFMSKTGAMLATDTREGRTVNIDGAAFLAAWRAIGCKGKPTYKSLRALPE